MSDLYIVDFKAKRLVSRHPLAELHNKHISFTCLCCRNKFTNDKSAPNYSQAVSWERKTQQSTQTLHVCKVCVDQMYLFLNGEGEKE